MNKLVVLLPVFAVALSASCSSSNPVSTVRFANAPVVWKVNDRLDVDQTPKENDYLRTLYHADSYYLLFKRRMELQRDRRAQGVNAFDEVPDSTWFTNRIGVRDVSPDEIRRGPGSGVSPEKAFPWTILKAKSGGREVGYLVEDARKRRFVLKFDRVRAPEAMTGADAVTSRLLWAVGYNVAEDHVVYFREENVRIAPDATVQVHGHDRKLTWSFLRDQLKLISAASDGSYRGLASMFIEGKPLGGAPRVGVREDDPNDRIPHELRRDQRGLGAFLAWLAHNDIKEDNTLDSYQQDPEDPNIQYVVHYLIDFGSALGAQALAYRRPYLDYQWRFDPNEIALSFLTLGVHRQPWEGRIDPRMRGVGLYAVDDFRPDKWKPASPGQYPIQLADRHDNFWASKIVMRLDRRHIQAAVDAGRYSDPASAKYLVDTIIGRQRKLARHWFSTVNPIDEIRLDGGRLCFTDLALHYGLETRPTTFTLRAFDENGTDTGVRRQVTADGQGGACVDNLAMVKDGSRYTIYRVDSSRGMPGTLIHLATDPVSRQPRVIGIFRL